MFEKNLLHKPQFTAKIKPFKEFAAALSVAAIAVEFNKTLQKSITMKAS